MTRQGARRLSTRERRRRETQAGARASRARARAAATIPHPPGDGHPWVFWWDPRRALWFKHRADVVAAITALATPEDERSPAQAAAAEAIAALEST